VTRMAYYTVCGYHMTNGDRSYPDCGRIVEEQPPAVSGADSHLEGMRRRTHVGSAAVAATVDHGTALTCPECCTE